MKNVKANKREMNGIIEKQCTKCLTWFPDTEDYFYKRNKKKPELGLNAICKECSRKDSLNRLYSMTPEQKKHKKIYKHNWYKDNEEYNYEQCKMWINDHKEERKDYVKQYRKDNKEYLYQLSKKHFSKSHLISKDEWKACLNYFDNQCAYCGLSMEEHKRLYNQQLHKEHVQYDGSRYLDNCVPACRSCNSSKHTEDMETWYKKQTYFDDEKLSKIHKWLNEDYKKYEKCHKA